ncbi:cytochrome c oxidase subunit 3, partial [bacterium]|nr:cytochrome c oxidase subunit 3 [bacterium]
MSANPYLAHHFDDPIQQRESVSFGMWIFLLTEIMFFGGIFATYILYRHMYPEMFHAMSHHLDVPLGTLNTGILLTSSLTMALAVNAAQRGLQKRLVSMLGITTLAGCGFLVIKYFEYAHKFHVGTVPGPLWRFESEYGDKAQLFYSLYFGATGLHGFHVLIGIVLLAYFTWNASRGGYPVGRAQRVEM